MYFLFLYPITSQLHSRACSLISDRYVYVRYTLLLIKW
ncbi:hypothetical protein ISN45_At02g035040 [Arabidopsis thaliana x Arabidopsis arenosa]|uniref:Uncharacterized protein n=2 Tax=Arabidopsis TaxID=3701 RepID=A0A8T2G8S7_ARASU|nr:hypothetical protein ISN45_At02g035040 [Arabidopsis thaliana x Arabidopsis arenosa]KAG7643744.1 hypothetical protein ISN44_As02g035190 [Arabidopsis suecica]